MGLPGAGKRRLRVSGSKLARAVQRRRGSGKHQPRAGLFRRGSHRTREAHGLAVRPRVEAGHVAIADFVCPTPETRAAFGSAFVVFTDRIQAGRFEDTNRLFVPPTSFDLRVQPIGGVTYWADMIIARLMLDSTFSPMPRRRLWVDSN